MTREKTYTVHIIQGWFDRSDGPAGVPVRTHIETTVPPQQVVMTARQLYRELRNISNASWQGLTLRQLRRHLEEGINAVLIQYKDEDCADVELGKIASTPQLVGSFEAGVMQ